MINRVNENGSKLCQKLPGNNGRNNGTVTKLYFSSHGVKYEWMSRTRKRLHEYLRRWGRFVSAIYHDLSQTFYDVTSPRPSSVYRLSTTMYALEDKIIAARVASVVDNGRIAWILMPYNVNVGYARKLVVTKKRWTFIYVFAYLRIILGC